MVQEKSQAEYLDLKKKNEDLKKKYEQIQKAVPNVDARPVEVVTLTASEDPLVVETLPSLGSKKPYSTIIKSVPDPEPPDVLLASPSSTSSSSRKGRKRSRKVTRSLNVDPEIIKKLKTLPKDSKLMETQKHLTSVLKTNLQTVQPKVVEEELIISSPEKESDDVEEANDEKSDEVCSSDEKIDPVEKELIASAEAMVKENEEKVSLLNKKFVVSYKKSKSKQKNTEPKESEKKTLSETRTGSSSNKTNNLDEKVDPLENKPDPLEITKDADAPVSTEVSKSNVDSSGPDTVSFVTLSKIRDDNSDTSLSSSISSASSSLSQRSKKRRKSLTKKKIDSEPCNIKLA